MKVRKRLLPLIMAAQALIVAVIPLTSLLQPTAYAGNLGQMIFYYPDSTTQNSVGQTTLAFQCLEASIPGCDKAALDNTSLYVQGGPFGSTPVQMPYNSGTANQDQHGAAYSLDAGQGYDCYIDSTGQPQLGIPNGQHYWVIKYDVFVEKALSKAISDPGALTATERISEIQEWQGPDPAAAQNGQPANAYEIAHRDDSGNDRGVNAGDFGAVGLSPNSPCLPPNYNANRSLSYTPLQTYYQTTPRWDLTNAVTSAGSANGTQPDEQCASAANGFGWLLCPAINLVNSLFAKPFQQLILSQLKIEPLNTTGAGSASNQQLFNTWDNLRTLANVLFVLVFMVVIFANTLQFNMNAYTIKKVIPKLVAAAILVQFSFVISALLIDFGNVLGDGVNGLIQTAVHGTGGGANPDVPGVLTDAGAAISGAVAIGVVATTSIVTIVSLAITALFAFLAIFFTLVIRKLIIDVLIVMSPLAFVAFVLPGTERIFKLWSQNFIRVVLMYPMIALLFSISGLLTAASGGTGWPQIIASAFPIIACFLVPATFKLAGSLMSKTGGFVNSRINKVGGQAKSGWKDSGAAKSLGNRQTSLREAGLDKLDRRLKKLNESNSKMRNMLGRTGFRAGAAAMGAPFATNLSRQRATSNLVNSYDKELKELKQATSSNIKDALRAKFGDNTIKDANGKTEQDRAMDSLRNNGASGLMSYTKTHEGRQAMMRRLADKDLTGPEMAKLIDRKGTDRDKEALKQENGKNLSSSLGLFGDFSSGGWGEGLLRGTTAADIKKDLKTNNFDAPVDAADTQGHAFEAAFSEHMSDVELGHTFDTNHRDSAGLDKRVAILRMMARNSATYNTSRGDTHGDALRKAVVTQLNSGKSQDARNMLSAAERKSLGIH